MKNYSEIVNEFIKDCKDIIFHLKTFKRQIKTIVPQKQQELAFYRNFVDFLVKYEETNTKSCQPIGTTSVDEMNVTLLSGDNKKVDIKDKL